jgi:hypothetical protein
VQRHDLVDVARQCYDEELARRGLHAAPPRSAGPVAEPGEAEEPLSVGTFTYPDEAKLAREFLKAAGIPCYLENEHTLAMNWFLTNALGGDFV